MFAVAKFDYSFKCPSYMSKNGVDFTLHIDNAHMFRTFEEAVYWHKRTPDTTVRAFPHRYESV